MEEWGGWDREDTSKVKQLQKALTPVPQPFCPSGSGEMKDHLHPHLSKPGESQKPAFLTSEILPSRLLGEFCSACDALRSSTGKGQGGPLRAMAEGQARGHTGAVQGSPGLSPSNGIVWSFSCSV